MARVNSLANLLIVLLIAVPLLVSAFPFPGHGNAVRATRVTPTDPAAAAEAAKVATKKAKVAARQANPKAVKQHKLDSPSKLQPRRPQASRRMGQRKRSKIAEPAKKKKDYSSFLCPGGAVACPVPVKGNANMPFLDTVDPATGRATPESAALLQSSLNSLADWFKVGFECVELDTELSQCGGCLTLGQGQDCSAIPNTRATGCNNGQCTVISCIAGYTVSSDKKSCVPDGSNPAQAPFGRR